MSTETNTPTESPSLKGKALLTGASGFIGGRLRDALLARGLEVVALRRRGSPAAKQGRSAEVEYDDLAGLERLVREEKPDVVFHLAGATKGVTRDDFSRANVMPTRNLLEALKKAHPEVQRFVHVSSLAAYGPSQAGNPHVESSARRPLEHYGDTKLEAERVVEAADVPWTILRPGGVYGPGDVDYFNLFREATQGRNVFFGNRNRWFSAVYVDDLVTALVAAGVHPGAVGKGFFVCDNEPVTWERFQQAIVDASGRRVRTLNLPEALVSLAAVGGELATKLDGKPRLFNRQKAKMGAQEAWTCRSDALRSAVGWNHEYGLERGVRAAFDWYRKEKWI
ncbi:NAD-dependent epimerase/dehydratase family protein [Chondromyces apiculatus]|uniref:NAD-dependent epimerase/dehydratase family protein n=1 Tax=Chondromyces apiculatus DSM 436 TaxID=1192034 RepID=A0A017T7Y7_9BACT|nr:NAD(P)-dependent oxidoreductase [Chondromyces apiculatus]EYF05359.1 NAD-dependent epimerase/dehydratase family protein [Chondromyces apiculatus DSM 436]